MKVLVLGASGMLGFAIHRVLHDAGRAVIGSLRGVAAPASPWCRGLHYALDVDVLNLDTVLHAVAKAQADVVINATGVIKQVSHAADPHKLIAINAVFPQLLDRQAAACGFRLVQFSTDCVFNGRRGNYSEGDRHDATDLYGMSKFLGEPPGPNTLVLRTSIIGRGLTPNASLVDWFLAQSGVVTGFRRATFSGLPVNEIASVLDQRILPRRNWLSGLHHLSAAPIDKFTLLELVRSAWSRTDLVLRPDDEFTINRSLDSSSLRSLIQYQAPVWPRLVSDMKSFYAGLEEAPTSV